MAGSMETKDHNNGEKSALGVRQSVVSFQLRPSLQVCDLE